MKDEKESFENVRARNYKNTFSGAGAEFVLMDLMKFCKVNQTSYTKMDPYETAFNEGKRDVYLHIMQMLNLSEMDVHRKLQNQGAPINSDLRERPTNEGTVSNFSKGLYT